MNVESITAALVVASLIAACSGEGGTQGAGSGDAGNGYGAQYQNDGIMCGAILCAAGQQCCPVYVAFDAAQGAPTHACDQGCESVCMDTCPDSGEMIQSFPPSATSMPMGMAPMGHMPADASAPGAGTMPGGQSTPAPGGGMPADAATPGPMGAGGMSINPGPGPMDDASVPPAPGGGGAAGTDDGATDS